MCERDYIVDKKAAIGAANLVVFIRSFIHPSILSFLLVDGGSVECSCLVSKRTGRWNGASV